MLNPMAIKRLLKFTPDEAIMMMINEELGIYLRPEICEVGIPVDLGGDLCRVTVNSKAVQHDMIQNPYSGEIDLTYNRYDLGALFTEIILAIEVPTTVSNVVDKLSEQAGIVLEESDFVPGVITSPLYVLRASSTSKRWWGSVLVTLEGEGDVVSIDTYLTNTRHAGLVISAKTPLYEIFPNDILNGLEIGIPPISVYLASNKHGGLVSTTLLPIDRYLATTHHSGLVVSNTIPIQDYIVEDHHAGLSV